MRPIFPVKSGPGSRAASPSPSGRARSARDRARRHRPAPRRPDRSAMRKRTSPACARMPSTTLCSMMKPSRGAGQVTVSEPSRLRSMSLMISSGTPRFSRRCRAPRLCGRPPVSRNAEVGDVLSGGGGEGRTVDAHQRLAFRDLAPRRDVLQLLRKASKRSATTACRCSSA